MDVSQRLHVISKEIVKKPTAIKRESLAMSNTDTQYAAMMLSINTAFKVALIKLAGCKDTAFVDQVIASQIEIAAYAKGSPDDYVTGEKKARELIGTINSYKNTDAVESDSAPVPDNKGRWPSVH